MDNIEDYIKENLRRGARLSTIKRALGQKYSSQKIEAAIRKIYKEQVTNLAKYINKELKSGLSASAVKNYLAAVGHPKKQVDAAVEKIINAKKYLLRKKKIEKLKEVYNEITKNIKKNLSGSWSEIQKKWDILKPWQRGAYIPSIVVFIVLLIWEIWMMISSITISGNLNCYSLGRVISCSFFESVLFYILLMIVFIVIFCLPVFGLGALAGYLMGRNR